MGTLISWTDESWNPVTGCSHVSDGCRFCYAETMSRRFGWTKEPWTHTNAPENVAVHAARLHKPYTWKSAKRVFVNSMSDLFHEQIGDDFIARVFAVMADLGQHTFQVLTKRPERAALWPGPWTPNIWMGTSVEDRRVLGRIEALRLCGAKTRFLSCEPLLGGLGRLDLRGIDWVIVGGESGRHIAQHPERVMEHAWARSVRDQCCAAEPPVPFFFKQSSGPRSGMGAALVEDDGSTTEWKQFPVPVREEGD